MMKKAWFLMMIFFISGCGTSGGYVRADYQEKNAVAKGQQFISNQGLYAVTVTADNYYVADGPTGIGFMPKASEAYSRGTYTLETFTLDEVPVEAREDLKKTFDWINESLILKRAGKKSLVLFTEERIYQGEKALYIESFMPGRFRKGYANLTVIDNPSFGYANIIFFHKDHLYWIYYSDPTDSIDLANPKVEEITKQRFEEFIDRVLIDPTRKV